MKKYLVPIFLLLTFIVSGQSVYKKDADQNKKNNIQQTDIYLIDKSKSVNAILFQTHLYDKEGRKVDSKNYTLNGELGDHSKFEYPNDTIRIKISLDAAEKELK